MSKRNKLVAIALAIIVSGTLIIGVGSCSRQEQIIYQQQPPTQQVVYVQHNGGWIEYAMWYHIMSNSGRPIVYNNYNFSTRGANGNYTSYKPSSKDFNSMKTGKFNGKALIAKPPIAVKQKTNLFGKKSYTPVNNSGKQTKSMFGSTTKSSTSSKSGFFSKSSSSSGKVSSFGGSSTRSSSGGFGG